MNILSTHTLVKILAYGRGKQKRQMFYPLNALNQTHWLIMDLRQSEEFYGLNY
jgi:hypothetical protein